MNFMISEATFLERVGKHTKRGEIKEGTYMVSFGVRYGYGMIGWYVHDNLQCYRRSEALASIIYGHLCRLFPSIIQHLYRIREMENMPENEGCIGETPFTGIFIIKNYSCKIHTDPNDYTFCFFIWLAKNGSPDVHDNSTMFYLPSIQSDQQQGFFVKSNVGDILLFKAGDIQHCTKFVGNSGQYGIALY